MSNQSASAVELLTDSQIQDGIENLIKTAQQEITLVSPFNQHWQELSTELEKTRGRGVKIVMYYQSPSITTTVQGGMFGGEQRAARRFA